METEPPEADPPKRKRRWFQFSLRTLMIFTIIVAVACGWLGNKIEQKRREREAVEAFVKAGGKGSIRQRRRHIWSRLAETVTWRRFLQ